MAGAANHWEAGRAQQGGPGCEPPGASWADHHQPGRSTLHVGPELVQLVGTGGRETGSLTAKGPVDDSSLF